jgi:acyl dehydratase
MMFQSSGRTITESDVLAFAGLSGDWNPIHVDAEFAKSSIYEQRIVYGLLGPVIATGMSDRLGIFSGSAIANLGVREWDFLTPLFIGDTIHLQLEILSVRPSETKPDRGLVERRFSLINQRGELAQTGLIGVMVRRRPVA